MYCKHCGESVSTVRTHYCKKTGKRHDPDDDGDFLTSVLIGFGTDSALAGGLLGGDMIGGVVGDLLDGDLFD
jgi:hypothetical protein